MLAVFAVRRPRGGHSACRGLRHACRVGRAAMRIVGQELGAHHGHIGARQQEGTEHGEGDGQGQRTEQKAAHAWLQRHRRQHDVCRQRRHQYGNHYFDGAVEGGQQTRLAHPVVPMGVFQAHDGVIHQRTDGQGHAAQRHGVDGVAGDVQADDRPQDGQRNGRAGDQRHAPIAQENQNHDRHQNGADDAFLNQTVNCLAHENRLIHHEIQLGAGRAVFLHEGDVLSDAIGNVEGTGTLLAIDGHVDLVMAFPVRRLAGYADTRGLDSRGILNVADVAQEDVVARFHANGQIHQFIDLVGHHVGVE